MHAAWTSACHDLTAVQAAWNKVLRQDLPRMNGVLNAKRLKALEEENQQIERLVADQAR